MSNERGLRWPVTSARAAERVLKDNPHGIRTYTRRSLEELELIAKLIRSGLAEPCQQSTIGEFLLDRSWKHCAESSHLFPSPPTFRERHWWIGLNAPSIGFVQLFDQHYSYDWYDHPAFDELVATVKLVRQGVVRLQNWLSIEDFLEQFER